MIEKGERLEGIAAEYTRSVLWKLIVACEDETKPTKKVSISGPLSIKGGRPPKGLGPKDVDYLSVVLTVEKFKRQGHTAKVAFAKAADEISISDANKVKKIFYKHWDGKTYYPEGRRT